MPLLALLRAATCAALLSLVALPAAASGVTVFAAASLKTALDQIVTEWQAGGGAPVSVAYAGSSVLARQIEQGAPADMFLSADEAWMDSVEKAGVLKPASRADLLGNALVLVAHDPAARPVLLDKGADLAGLLGQGKLAMALVDSVPAGIYGKQALSALGQWDRVAPQVAQADNVRAALALVSTGEAPYGIVYATDAVADHGVTVVGTFPEDSHVPIVYPVALTATAGPEAAGFLAYLKGAKARAVFVAQGFTVQGR